jgi:hypothetical protein
MNGSATIERCLLVTKEFATTPTSGGTLRTLALCDQLARHYDTTVISPEGVLVTGPRGRAIRTPPGDFGGGRWERVRTATRYRSISGVRTAGARLLANLHDGAFGRYDVAVIDHTCLAGLADAVAAGSDRVVISMHNVESQVMAQRAATASSRASRLLMSAEARLLRRLETRLAGRYPVVVCTDADARALPAGAPTIVCRNGVFPSAAPPARARRPASVVFSGALDWEPNVEGLAWFVEKVWSRVRQRVPDAEVTVAGRRPGRCVIGLCSAPGITLRADPPVMSSVLAGHAIGIVPLLVSGGSRIKILEYLAAGLDVVATQPGAAGLDDVPTDLLDRAPADPVAFADHLVARLRRPRDVTQAPDWVHENYSWTVTLRPLLDFLTADAGPAHAQV